MKLCPLLLVVCLCAVPVMGKEPSKLSKPADGTKLTTSATGKEARILELMDIMGMKSLMDQVMSQMIADFRRSMPNVPPAFWDTAEEEFRREPLLPMVTPLYDKYFTEEDLDVIVLFYRSPTGQKMIKTLPQITTDSMQIGQQWGRRVLGRMADRLLEKDYVTKEQAEQMKKQ